MNAQVCILLCTYNGDKFLCNQLDSIAEQTHLNWKVIASDDGSSDATLEILKSYQVRWGKEKLEIKKGPEKGFAHNFLSMACDPKIRADFYAFCDQDDIWLPTKLEKAIENISEKAFLNEPYVYCGRARYVNEELNLIGDSPLFVFPRTFRNALVQSIAGGNTMVFNQNAKVLLEKTGALKVVSHDWWLYILVAGAGGVVYYDPIPYVLYRQHSGSLIGSNHSFFAQLRRIKHFLMGRFKIANTLHAIAIRRVMPFMTSETQAVFEEFMRLRSSTLRNRFRMVEVCGLYRQSWRGSISLYLAALLNKI
jgi:glycosyltransferase involved in cell wall biosynthesis